MKFPSPQANLLSRLWKNFPHRRKVQLLFLLMLTILASCLEVVSIGAVVPFLGVMTSPQGMLDSAMTPPHVARILQGHADHMMLFVTIAFSGVALLSGGARFLLLWAQMRLGHAIGAGFSTEIYRRTLYQPYAVHLGRNSSEIISGITVKTSVLVNNTVLPLLTVFSASIMLVSILTVLIFIDPVVAISSFSGFAGIYLVAISVTKKRLSKDGERLNHESSQVIKALQEGLGGIRDVLLDGAQNVYCRIYERADLPLRRAQANIQILSGSPRFIIEALAITLIAWMSFAMANADSGITSAIPILGAIAVGAQRLLPVQQQIYLSVSAFRAGQASLKDALDLLEQELPECINQRPPEPLKFVDKLTVIGLSYRYGDSARDALDNINLEIPKGARVGFIGTTGCGKSTLLDLLMGLLEPSKGSVLVDGVPITAANRRAWQANISHVPQMIFLADATIAENIAFGIPLSEIDQKQVQLAAQRAQLGATINALPDGFQTITGECGIRLSGGQRQRIGIARAMYKHANLIVLDEATSALDNETERSIIKSIDQLGREYTVLMVAHRLSTLSGCDRIFEMEFGQIKKVWERSEISKLIIRR